MQHRKAGQANKKICAQAIEKILHHKFNGVQIWLINLNYIIFSYHALAWFGTTRLKYQHSIIDSGTELRQTMPTHRKLLSWYGLAWLGFLQSNQTINF